MTFLQFFTEARILCTKSVSLLGLIDQELQKFRTCEFLNLIYCITSAFFISFGRLFSPAE